MASLLSDFNKHSVEESQLITQPLTQTQIANTSQKNDSEERWEIQIPSYPVPIYLQLQNVTGTTNFGKELQLDQIASKVKNAEYSPKRFGAVILRLRSPRSTALFFKTGKCVVTGCKTERQAHTAARKFATVLHKVGYSAQHSALKIRNMVMTTDVGFPIRLEGLVMAHSAFASYEPELFPGLIYRMKNPAVTLLVFVSGKIVVTGAKAREDLKKSIENIFPVLFEFRKVPVVTNVDTSSAVSEQSQWGN